MSVPQLYILRCADGTLYTGMTTNLVRRLRQHNGEIKGGARYTAARRPVRLVYSRRFYHMTRLRKAEARVKRMTRAQKLAVIEGRREP